MQFVGRNSSVDDILKCLNDLYSIINLSHMNNVVSLVNIDCNELSRVTIRNLGEAGMVLRVNNVNGTTTKACLLIYLSSRKTKVK